MRRHAPATLTTSLEQSNLPIILSEFQTDGHQFLIVSLENNPGTKLCLAKLADQFKTYVEVGRFQVLEQLCVIVKVEQISSIEIDLISLLTERELQIAALVASGQGNKQIANQLRISGWTVSTHLRRIFIKLGVDSRAAMVYRCAPIIQKLSKQVETPQEY